MTGETNKRLIKEYISKVECCDECFASVYCTVNGLRESRVPQDYCVKNIERYFNDKASQTGAERREFQQWVEALEQEPILDKIRAEIEKAVWEDSIYSRDGSDEVRIPRLDPDDVFAILDKYKAESEDK